MTIFSNIHKQIVYNLFTSSIFLQLFIYDFSVVTRATIS